MHLALAEAESFDLEEKRIAEKVKGEENMIRYYHARKEMEVRVKR